MEFTNNPIYEHGNNPESSSPMATHFDTTPHNPQPSFEEPSSGYGEAPSMDVYRAPSTSPSTVIKSGAPQSSLSITSFQDQIQLLETMFPNKTQEELVAFIWPSKKGNTPVPSASHADVAQTSHR